MLGNRAVWRRMSAVSAARSDLFNAFPNLEGGCPLTSEAPATFFWALCLVLAIGTAALKRLVLQRLKEGVCGALRGGRR